MEENKLKHKISTVIEPTTTLFDKKLTKRHINLLDQLHEFLIMIDALEELLNEPQQTNMKIIQANVAKSKNQHKEVVDYARNNKIDIVAISEPYYDTLQKRMAMIPGIAPLYGNETESTRSIVYVLNKNVKIKQWFVSDNIVELKCTTKDTKKVDVNWFLMGVYIPPSGQNNEWTKVNEILNTFSNRIKLKKKDKTIVVGDLNDHFWFSEKSNSTGKIIDKLLKENNFIILNDPNFCTYRRNNYMSILDLTMASPLLSQCCLKWSIVKQLILPDHFAIESHWNIPATITIKWTISAKKIAKETAKLIADQETECMTYEDLINNIKKVIPKIRQETNEMSQPWMTKELKALKDDLRKWNNLRSKIHNRLNEEETLVWNKKKAHYKKKLKQEKTNFIINNPKGITHAKNEYWQTNNPLDNLTILKEENEIITDQDEIMKIVFGYLKYDMVSMLPQIEENDIIEPDITIEEIQIATRRLKLGKAKGLDGLSSKLVKSLMEFCPTTIWKIMNGIYTTGIIPEQLKHSKMVFIKKKPSQVSTFNTLRPLGIQSNFMKLLELIITRRLIYWAKKTELDDIGQYAYSPGKNLNQFHQIVFDFIRSNSSSVIMFSLDIKKAFDSVNHQLMLKEIKSDLIPWKLSRMIRELMNERIMKFQGTEKTYCYKKTRGIIQGSVISPLLFAILLNTLLKKIRNTFNTPEWLEIQVVPTAYADDVNILIIKEEKTNNEEILKALKCIAENIQCWLDDCEMEIAVDKSALINLKGGTSLKNTIQIQNSWINEATTIKTLGLTYTLSKPDINGVTNVNMNEQFEEVKSKLIRLAKKISSRAKTTFAIKKKIYDCLIHPTWSYLVEFWGPCLSNTQNRTLEVIFRRIILAIVNGPPSTPSCAIYPLSGIPPIKLEIKRMCNLDRASKKGVKIGNKIRCIESNEDPIYHFHPAEIPKPIYGGKYFTEKETERMEPSDVTIYTDGSKTEDLAGFAIAYYENKWKALLFKTPAYATVFQLECMAVEYAMTHHKTLSGKQNVKKLTICTDSESCLRAVMSPCNNTYWAHRIRTKIKELKEEGTEVTLSWVKAHVDIVGNNRADAFAKCAKTKGALVEAPVSKSWIRKRTYDEMMSDWVQTIEEAEDTHFKRVMGDLGSFIKSYKPIHMDEKQIAFFTGHGNVLKYGQKKFKKNISETCKCNAPSQTAAHVLFECEYTNEIRKKAKMAAKLNTTVLPSEWINTFNKDPRLWSFIHHFARNFSVKKIFPENLPQETLL